MKTERAFVMTLLFVAVGFCAGVALFSQAHWSLRGLALAAALLLGALVVQAFRRWF